MAENRRAKGEGGIYRRKDGRWAGQYVVETAAGPKRRYVYGKSRKEAAERLRKALADRDGGLTFDAGSLTLGDYLCRWLNDSVRDTVKAKTFEGHEARVRVHVAPLLGRLKLKALNPADIQRLYRQKLDQGLSSSTVQCVHKTLHKALKQAVRWGLIPRNVTDAVDAPRPSEPEIVPLDAKQLYRFLHAAKDDRLFALYQLAATTGLRLGELLGLRWKDIDLGRGVLSVNRTLTRTGADKLSFDRPKSAKSRRSVGLTPDTLEVLKEHRQRQRAEGLGHDEGLVFCSGRGTPLNPSNVRNRSFKPLFRRAGLPDVTFHAATRHTYATLLLSEGVHPKIVQELLGHARVGLTLDTYSHVLPGMGDGAVRAIRDALSEPDNGGRPKG